MTSQQQSLYGGAASIVYPSYIRDNYRVIDVSTLRQVPDTQEVFMLELARPSTGNSPFLDKSLVIDLLEMVPAPEYDAAIDVHIGDLFADASPIPKNVFVSKKDHAFISFVIHPNDRRDATQPGAPSEIITFLALIRLEKVTTDVLISINVPIAEFMSEAQLVEAIKSDFPDSDLRKVFDAFSDIASSFKIENWSLFG